MGHLRNKNHMKVFVNNVLIREIHYHFLTYQTYLKYFNIFAWQTRISIWALNVCVCFVWHTQTGRPVLTVTVVCSMWITLTGPPLGNGQRPQQRRMACAGLVPSNRWSSSTGGKQHCVLCV